MAFLMKRSPAFLTAPAFTLLMIPACFSLARAQTAPAERVVVCMIQLEHADAEELAAVLKPLLSPAGTIAAYKPTNTLIIKDRASVVEKLSIVIKGSPCNPISSASEDEPGDFKKESHPGQ